MNDYLAGKKLYGDDFSIGQIQQWYDAEAEGYANLGSKDISIYAYEYHTMNKMYGFDKIKNSTRFENVLGFGSAWGHEFEPITAQIAKLTIIEPSDMLVSNKVGHLTPHYVKPTVDGRLAFESNSFDLITCFGTLHHIPNVSFILSEIIRVLKPNGHLLLREPIISMGDWNTDRKGLTKNERGIPAAYFQSIFEKEPVNIVSFQYCFTMTSLLQRKIGGLFKRPIYAYKSYMLFDKFISNLLAKNVKYHATNKIDRIAPSAVFCVIEKLPST